jgi:hypothetical protein
MVTVSTNGLCVKFLDTMKYAPPQSLDSFGNTFCNNKDLQKDVFAYYGFNSTNYIKLLNNTEPYLFDVVNRIFS